jgi:hypothetical protein
MTDSIIISAECDALREQLRLANSRIEEFERATTNYPPSEYPTRPELGSDSLVNAWSSSKSATSLLDDATEYLRGKVDGISAALAQLSASYESALKILDRLDASLDIAINEGRKNSERISLLELSLAGRGSVTLGDS